MIDGNVVGDLCRLGVLGDSESLEAQALLKRLRPHGKLGSRHWEEWNTLTDTLDTARLVSLVRGLLLTEEALSQWSHGSVSPVIWTFRALQGRDREAARLVAEWGCDKTTNSYVPFWKPSERELEAQRLAKEAKKGRIESEQANAKQRRHKHSQLAAEHVATKAKNARERADFLDRLADRPLPERLQALSENANRALSWFPESWATEANGAVADLSPAVRDTLIERLTGHRQGPWRHLREALVEAIVSPTSTRLLLGIDVGWSASRRSCALATTGQVSQSRCRSFKHGVSVGLYTLDELLDELAHLLRDHLEAFQSAVLVIDGPVGPHIDAVPSRAVDSLFSRGGFRNRAPAYPIAHGSGLMLSRTSARILRLLDGTIPVRPWLGGPLPSDGLAVVETNPTPALAMLLPQQDVATLPSRGHPKYVDGRLISAKSDWYWRLGAGAYAARVLRDESIALDTNHERVAGLFALALASELTRGEAAVAALGDKDGIYLVAANIDQTWRADVERIGIAHGQVKFVRHQVVELKATNVQTLEVPNAKADETILEGTDDSVLVVLNDNGGLNVAANPWLDEVSVPCQLEAANLSFTVEAAFHGRKDMFRITPSAKALAKRLGFAGKHLSKTTPLTFQATIVATKATLN
jgi:hypothetical protein